MTESYNLSEVNCNKTFKNILRNKIESDFHKEHLKADYKDIVKNERSINSYRKYFNVTNTEPDQTPSNLNNKYTSHYLKGNLKSNFDLKNEPQPGEQAAKYSHIRTRSAIEINIPELKKSELSIFKQDQQESKLQKTKETKIKTFVQNNNSKNICKSFKPNDDLKSNVSESQYKRKIGNFLNSEQIKNNIYANYNTIDVSRADKITNTNISSLQKPSNKDKKFLKNAAHNFTGKRGFYC